MALNALQADMVRFTGTPGIEANGIVVGYKAEYTPRTSTDPKYNRLIDNKHSSNIDYSGQYYVQLGEELYNGDLTKKHVTDDFERPSYNWQFKGKEIGTYVDYTVLVNGGTFTEAVKYSELYELLTYTTIDDNDVRLFVDGVEDTTLTKSKFARSNKDEVGGQGVLTEVFVDRDRELVTISCINTYLAQANSDYNSTNETLSLKVYQTSVSGTTKIVDVKDVPEAANVVKDDYRLVYLSGKDSPTNYEVVRMFNVDIMADSTVTKWSKADAPNVVDKLTTGGTEYKSNDKAFYDRGNVFEDYDKQLLTDTTYNIYMDRYGNVIGVDLYEGTKNYVFITGYDRRGSNISVNTATAAGIFTDGTMSTITVNVTDTNKNIDRYNAKFGFNNANANTDNSYFQQWTNGVGSDDGVRDLNRWYTYTVTNSGVYTLKPVERSFYTAYTAAADNISNATPKVLNSANLYVDDDRSESYNDTKASVQRERAYGNDDSIYITVSADDVDTSHGVTDAITDVEGVYTGAQNVKLELTPDVKSNINDRKKDTEKDAYVYTVYDNKYYIVASIVMGEAQGANANYAYILSDAKNERVESEGNSRAEGDLTYYWEFEAVVNGEKTTLTAKSKYTNVFDPTDVVKYTMRELRFDGDYVVDVKPIDKSKFHIYNTSNTGIDKADIYDVGNMVGLTGWSTSGVMDSPKSDVIQTGNRVAGTIELVGRTLYVNPGAGTDRGVGLALASDAKAVLIQPENGDREVTSCGSVSEALGRLADRGSNKAEYTTDPDGIQFRGRIAAVLDDGVAKWVVIISDTNLVTGNNPNYTDKTGSDEFMINNTKVIVTVKGLDVKKVEATIDRATGLVEIYVPKDPSLARAVEDENAWKEHYDSVTVRINNGVTMDATYSRSTASYYVFVVEGVRVNTEKDNVVVITVTAKGSTTEKPPVTEPGKVTEVKLDKTSLELKVNENATLKATVTAGEGADKTVTWTSSDNTVATVVGGKVTAVKAGTATITATAGDKSATCTVKVTEGTVPPPAGDITVKIEPDEDNAGQYIFTVEASGKAPTNPEIIAAINAEITKQGLEINAIDLISGGKGYDAAGKPVGTITATTSYNVYVNDKLAGTVKGDTWTQTDKNVAANLALMDKTAGGIATSARVTSDAFGVLASTNLTGITKDTYLVPAYQMAIGSTSVNTKVAWEASGEKGEADDVSSTPCFPEGAKLTVTGTKTTADGNNLTLSVGATYKDSKAAAAKVQTWTFTVGKTMLDNGSADTFTVTEDATTTTKIMFGSKTITTTETVTSNFHLPYADAKDLVGRYIQVMGTTDQTLHVLDAAVIDVTTETVAGTMKVKVEGLTAANKYAVEKGADYVLLPVGRVQFAHASDVQAMISYAGNGLNLNSAAITSVTADTSYYLPVGAEVKLVKNSSITNAEYKIIKTVNSVDTVVSTKEGGSYTVVDTPADTDVPKFSLLQGVASITLANGAVLDTTSTPKKPLAAILGTLVPATSCELTTAAGTVDTTNHKGTVEIKAMDGFYLTKDTAVAVSTTPASANGQFDITADSITKSFDATTGVLTISFDYTVKS